MFAPPSGCDLIAMYLFCFSLLFLIITHSEENVLLDAFLIVLFSFSLILILITLRNCCISKEPFQRRKATLKAPPPPLGQV